ncbi:class I SAM-dependent methyltransferase [Peribacillus simplex]|uniref:class I SAM-dependent methyltransferase n=1 Tax=Peribacillus simplex TaxID=1478 RepID=UPI00333A5A74
MLEIGCGTGRTTFALYKKGFQNPTGIDLTPAMLNEAEKIGMQQTSLSTAHHSIKQFSLLMV